MALEDVYVLLYDMKFLRLAPPTKTNLAKRGI
jgi:hypothetical protein